ncbi:hypothetical protein PG984_001166 [Apiospora sp. TS-2023a]
MATAITPNDDLLRRVQEHTAMAVQNHLRSTSSSSHTGSGALIATICVLVIVLLGAAIGYLLLRRFFQKKRKQNAPLRTFVRDQSGA